jgi:pimeloyl-ACP methyl ester carboxylesterase
VEFPPATLVRDGLAARVVDGGGESLLWLHGYTLDSSIWGPLWQGLPAWRHIGLDLPGHGASEPLRRRESLPELARRVGAFALAEGVRHIIGLSLGAMIALQVAIECPESFRSLILCSPPVGGGPQDPAARTRNLELARLYSERHAGPWMTALWMQWPPDIFKGAAHHAELWSQLQSVIDRHSWAELTDSRMQGLTVYPQQVRQLGRIRASTLVLVGEEDMPAFKRCAELLRRAIPNCERIYWPGAGHLALLEAAGSVPGTLEAHLRAAS